MEFGLDAQQTLILENGLKGRYVPRVFSMVAKNLLGWKDREGEEQTACLTDRLESIKMNQMLEDIKKIKNKEEAYDGSLSNVYDKGVSSINDMIFIIIF